MIKELKIDYYMDGISEEKFVCTEIPLAAACGFFSYDNYFIYLLQLCIYNNWHTKEIKQINEFSEMGLQCMRVKIGQSKKLIGIIKAFIDHDMPVLLPIKNESIFFSKSYKKIQSTHYILVNGYDDETNVLLTRLSPHVFSTSILNDNIGLYPYRIKNEHVIEMWKESNLLYRENDSYYNSILVVEKIHDAQLTTIYDIIEKFIKTDSYKQSLFVANIKTYTWINNKQFREDLTNIKGYNDLYMVAFFYILKKYMKQSLFSNCLIKELQELELKYLKQRSLYISKFQKSVIQQRSLDCNEILKDTMKYDERLYNILLKISSEWNKKCINDGTDYAQRAIVSASSKDEIYFEPENVCMDKDEMWRSADVAEPHWILFEFKKPIRVNKVTIEHDKNPNKITRNYCIECSNNLMEWHTLDSIKDNNNFITEHFLSIDNCKYLRIYITVPSKWFIQARIKRVSIWGMTES